MTDAIEPALTDYLNRWARDGAPALDALFPKVYDELRALARGHMDRAGRQPATLQPTVLVNEAYLRLSRQAVTPFASRREFFAFASKVIRHVLVDHVRKRLRDKRGGDADAVPIDGLVDRVDAQPAGLDPLGLLGLHQALERLEASYPQQARVVELRFFAGLTHTEIAETTGISVATVERHWTVGKRRLASWLGPREA